MLLNYAICTKGGERMAMSKAQLIVAACKEYIKNNAI